MFVLEQAGNEAAFNQLKAEMSDLEKRLRESEDLNMTLQDQLNLTQAGILLPDELSLAEQLTVGFNFTVICFILNPVIRTILKKYSQSTNISLHHDIICYIEKSL